MFQYSPTKGKRYTDALGRSLYAILLAQKSTNVTKCIKGLRPDISFLRTYSVECDSSGNSCSGMIAVSEEGRAIYLSFRDASSKKQHMLNKVITSSVRDQGSKNDLDNGGTRYQYYEPCAGTAHQLPCKGLHCGIP
ncbi:hypothetical protein RB195_024040 [Necator americanus]|uniref:Uncharacterized protein n=1 Tax=Necator americanus TaxID=51031 RepID=A0ABR1ELL6_NECAM